MTNATEIKIGDGVTVRGWSDATACTVISVTGKRAVIQEDTVELINHAGSAEADALKFSPGGFVGHTSGVQRWDTKPNPDGATVTITRRKDGAWRVAGESMKGKTIMEGRHHHYDFNF